AEDLTKVETADDYERIAKLIEQQSERENEKRQCPLLAKRASQLCWNKNTHQPQLGWNKNTHWPKLRRWTQREGTMFRPLVILAIILAGAFAGAMVRRRVPEHHLTEETKNLVSVSMAVVATISALVLGLLLSNANNSFNAVQGPHHALGGNPSI